MSSIGSMFSQKKIIYILITLYFTIKFIYFKKINFETDLTNSKMQYKCTII